MIHRDTVIEYVSDELGNLENVNSPFLFLDFIFKIMYSLRGLNLESNYLSAKRYKNLHCRNNSRNRDVDVDSERDRRVIGSINWPCSSPLTCHVTTCALSHNTNANIKRSLRDMSHKIIDNNTSHISLITKLRTQIT